MAFSPCSAHGGLPLGRYMLTSKWRVLKSCLTEEGVQKAARLQRVAVQSASQREDELEEHRPSANHFGLLQPQERRERKSNGNIRH